MKHEVPIRIIINRPLSGVDMGVQKGRHELLWPKSNGEQLMFDLVINVDLSGGPPNFLGPFAQGPKDSRFIYVNSGKCAGQRETCWERRAKLSLMSVTPEQVKQVLDGVDARLETTISGTALDGGPICASVKGLQWKIGTK